MDTDSNENDTTDVSSTWTEKALLLMQRLLYDIWTSPINLILVGLILFLLLKLVLLKRKPSTSINQNKSPGSLPQMVKCDLTVAELRGYNGIESNGRILTAIYGEIFDVSRRSDLYGLGR
jgi:membrane-associated progesterone receptor component